MYKPLDISDFQIIRSSSQASTSTVDTDSDGLRRSREQENACAEKDVAPGCENCLLQKQKLVTFRKQLSYFRKENTELKAPIKQVCI